MHHVINHRTPLFKPVPARTKPDPERIKAARLEWERRRAAHIDRQERLTRLYADVIENVKGG